MGQVDKTIPDIQQSLDQSLDGDPSLTVGWKDKSYQLGGYRLDTTVGKVQMRYDDLVARFEPNGTLGTLADMIGFSAEKNHDMAEDTEFRFHLHWKQDGDGVLNPTFAWRYRIQNNGQPWTDTWITGSITSDVSNEAFTRPTAGNTVNQITNLFSLDMSGTVISSTVQFQFTRTDSTTGDVDVVFADFHYETDQSRGSRQEYIK